MAGGKAEEPQPHPPKEQLPNISYCITSPPPWPEAIILGFQHYLVALGTIVIIPTALVPQMGGGNKEKADVIQTLLLVAGLNTLLQSLFGTRLPAVIGASYTYVPTTISIILAGRFSDETDPIEVLGSNSSHFIRFGLTIRETSNFGMSSAPFNKCYGELGPFSVFHVT